MQEKMIDEGRGKAEDNSWKATSSDETLQAPFTSHVPARQKVEVLAPVSCLASCTIAMLRMLKITMRIFFTVVLPTSV